MVAAAPTPPVHRRGAALAPAPPETPPEGLEGLATAARGCRACPLWEQATQTVPGEGPAGAAIMLVGEQPGDAEDIAGRPFVGPAGKVLDRALHEAGLERGALYLTNAVKHFKFAPRGKKRIHKRPETTEIHACQPWLAQEIALVQPRIVVMLGGSAANAVLGHSVAVTQQRGRPFRLPGGAVGVIATHPSYILRLQDRHEADLAYRRFVEDLAAVAHLASASGDEDVRVQN
jgi:uracil-DNA glycosylase